MHFLLRHRRQGVHHPDPQHARSRRRHQAAVSSDMLGQNRAAQLAIRDAAFGGACCTLQPSRNPNANAVFGAVLDAMIEFHQDQATKPEPALGPGHRWRSPGQRRAADRGSA